MRGDLPVGWEEALPVYGPGTKEVATRKTSESVLQALGTAVPELMGGAADLNPSTFSWLKGMGDFQKPGEPPACREGACGGEWGYGGRNIHFGVREHAMAAIAGGMALPRGIIPFTGTFFTFADYMRPSIRLAALMGLHVIYIFSHDSIGVGEDGPTHQPVEQLMSLRAIPNLTVIRPADANETVEAWRMAVKTERGPTALIFTRQNLPVADRSTFGPADGLRKGGYVFWESAAGRPEGERGDGEPRPLQKTVATPEAGLPEAILIGTGSELHLALAAAKTLAAEGIRVRVVSLPSWELFDRQPQAYRDQILPPGVRARVAVEAGIRLGWEHYVGLEGAVVGIDRFGASAPYQILYREIRDYRRSGRGGGAATARNIAGKKGGSPGFALPGSPGIRGANRFKHEFGCPRKIKTTVGNHERSDIGDESGIAQFLATDSARIPHATPYALPDPCNAENIV